MKKQISLSLLAGLVAWSVGVNAPVHAAEYFAKVEVPAGWTVPVSAESAVISDEWWQEFGDPILNTLVRAALASNQDLAVAAARIEQARALVDSSEADRRPRLDAGVSGQRTRDGSGAPSIEQSSIGLRAGWEVDLFGRGAQGISAAKADAEVARMAWQAARIALAADVATAYFELRTLDQRLVLRREAVDVLQRQVGVASRKFEAGMVASLEVQRWRVELARENATLAEIQAQQDLRLRQLSLLLGSSALPDLSSAGGPGRMVGAPATSLPGELLERRPDVQRQARALDAALARAGVAKREVYPSLQINWSGSRERIAELGASAAPKMALGYGVSLSMPILDGGRIKANIAVQDARVKEAAAEYEKAILAALVDVESRLTQWSASGIAQDQWEQAHAAAVIASQSAKRVYDAGSGDVSAVLDTRRAQLQSAEALVLATGARWEAAIGLRRAFAGSL
ncbi:efflux transporter outer membrane subunit [Pseudoduganella sp. FT93W]|uniref:Efflux transporter outer membrane subunit n=1 Tax=Duganella fentianensis TaxID=2692177 RepID=A0A845HUS9_9BURK|nr:efflux transporter outer membrane subunit [Duganella fentianensis]MYN44779.1 efflux transporter outer membrane subunit [Duganella fentianensis]